MKTAELIHFGKEIKKNAGLGRFIFDTAGRALKRKFGKASEKVFSRRGKLLGRGKREMMSPELRSRYTRAKKRQLSKGRFIDPLKTGLITTAIAGGIGAGGLAYGPVTQPGKINTETTRGRYSF